VESIDEDEWVSSSRELEVKCESVGEPGRMYRTDWHGNITSWGLVYSVQARKTKFKVMLIMMMKRRFL